MADWFCINVENESWSTVMDEIIQKFNRLISTTGLSDKAVFGYRHRDENLTTVYFPPGVEALVKECGAEACEMPKNDSHLSIVIGSSSCFDHFYPSAAKQ